MAMKVKIIEENNLESQEGDAPQLGRDLSALNGSKRTLKLIDRHQGGSSPAKSRLSTIAPAGEKFRGCCSQPSTMIGNYI
jgi:hypothetical protein